MQNYRTAIEGSRKGNQYRVLLFILDTLLFIPDPLRWYSNPRQGMCTPSIILFLTMILQPSLIWEQGLCPQTGQTSSSIVQSFPPWNSLTLTRLNLDNIWKENLRNMRLLARSQRLEHRLNNQWRPPTLHSPPIYLPSPINYPGDLHSLTREPFRSLTWRHLLQRKQLTGEMWILPWAWTKAHPRWNTLSICWRLASVKVVGLGPRHSDTLKMAPVVLF